MTGDAAGGGLDEGEVLGVGVGPGADRLRGGVHRARRQSTHDHVIEVGRRQTRGLDRIGDGLVSERQVRVLAEKLPGYSPKGE